MATLRVINNTADDLAIVDTGIVLEPSSSTDFTDAGNTRNLIMSQDLRTLVAAGSITLQDEAGLPVAILDLYNYWARCGFNLESKTPTLDLWIKSPNGVRWKITVDDLGILSTTKVP